MQIAAGKRNDTNNSTRPFSAPNLNTSGIDILPNTRDMIHAAKAKNSSSPIPAMLKELFFMISPPIEPVTNPNKLPAELKIANTINFPETKSFFDMGIIIAYRAHLE